MNLPPRLGILALWSLGFWSLGALTYGARLPSNDMFGYETAICPIVMSLKDTNREVNSFAV